ncbi:MAG TPA: DUF418 domain-containing protein [Allosphingosinicella sp.]|nr:DUF418 domain-containing protein [Allosphingosinicella sp.]
MATIAADTNPVSGVAPAAPAATRIEALDFVRGAALFGILLMNITGFGLPGAYFNPHNAGGADGANLSAWMITMIGFEGTQRALFSMLFGASVILLTARLEASGRRDAADIYIRRNLWLVGFGLVNAFVFLWDGDILYAYGITALFAFPFRRLGPKPLLAIGLAALAGATAWNASETAQMLGKHEAFVEASAARQRGARLDEEQQGAITAWEEARGAFKSTPAETAENISEMTSGLASAFVRTAGHNAHWQSWGLYRYFFDIFGMMLIGMALFKLGVLTLERRKRLYVAMMLAGYAVGLAINAYEVQWIMSRNFSAISFAQNFVTYDLGRLFTAVGHLGALLLFVRSGALSWLRRSLAAVGQMAVTNYLTHSLVCAIFFVGFGFYGQLERHQLYFVVFAIWAVQLVVSPLWLRRYRFGPVEWLWRWLTYLERPPFRRVGGVNEGLSAATARA